MPKKRYFITIPDQKQYNNLSQTPLSITNVPGIESSCPTRSSASHKPHWMEVSSSDLKSSELYPSEPGPPLQTTLIPVLTLFFQSTHMF